jgi:hypothetical protein
MQLGEDEGAPKIASANGTSQSANQSHYFADNLRVQALAQSHRPFETDLKEDEDGRLIALVVDVVNKNVLIYQVRIPRRDEEDQP